MTSRPHVLFVDDEPRILGGLRRMLRTHRDRWDMSFAEGSAAALTAMSQRPCDVIVSDYRMPGMDGAELLERVRRDYPNTARVILSGQTNEDNLLRIMVLAHEFLTKPSTPEELISTVERLLGVRQASNANGSPHEMAFAESLPSSPNTLNELVAALDAENASAQSVGTVIERDPAATAKVLHLVNSAAYSAGRNVSDVEQAVSLLGLHTVRGLVLMHDLIRTFDAGGGPTAEWIDGLTLHSVETSRLTRLLAAGQEWASHAFAAGLLHEVGQLVLASAQPAVFRDVLTTWQSGGSGDCGASLQSCEADVFHVTHTDVGVRLLGLWGLPVAVVDAVAGHIAEPGPDPGGDPTSAVALAHRLVEQELGPACGPPGGASPAVDEERLPAPVRDAVSQWRRERSAR